MLGMEHRTLMGSERDYLVLDFKGTDKLYPQRSNRVHSALYRWGDTSLSRMGGAEFAKQKQRVRSAVSEIAQELVVFINQRLANRRTFLSSRDTVDERTFRIVSI